jgi:hypothetical protein
MGTRLTQDCSYRDMTDADRTLAKTTRQRGGKMLLGQCS